MRDELLMEIRVTCREPVSVDGANRKITQKIEKDGSILLSARYMLEGTDSAGNACRVFVENQGNWTIGFTPSVVTDSPLLAGWETASLYATADGIPEGVLIRIFSGEP